MRRAPARARAPAGARRRKDGKGARFARGVRSEERFERAARGNNYHLLDCGGENHPRPPRTPRASNSADVTGAAIRAGESRTARSGRKEKTRHEDDDRRQKERDHTSPRDADVANARLAAFSRRMSRPLHPFASLHRGARSRAASRAEAAVWRAAPAARLPLRLPLSRSVVPTPLRLLELHDDGDSHV